jgi:PAS domain S-box-containing protein
MSKVLGNGAGLLRKYSVEFQPSEPVLAAQGGSEGASEGHAETAAGPENRVAALDSAYFRTIVETVPAAIYVTDADGRITFYNEAAAELWGCRPELGKSEFCGSWKLYWPDGTPLPHDQCPMALALRERRPVRGMEAVAERPDGTRIPFMPYPTPSFDDSGNLIGAVNLLVEISDRKLAEQANERLALIVESSDDAIVSKDLNGVITSWNRGAARLFGYAPDEVIGKPVTILIPEDRPDEEPQILRRIRQGERIDHYETVRRRKDGSLIDISLTVSPIRDGAGRIVGASKIARDITERRRAEQTRDMLLQEMQHRMKNTLALVQSYASQTLQSATKDELASFTARLRALGGAHELLASRDWDQAHIGQIVRRALEPFHEAHAGRIVIEGPGEVTLVAGKSLLLTLTLHELATNAVKYGALSNGCGQVHVEWDVVDSQLRLQWRESGGPAVAAPERKGFGSRLIEGALNGQQDSTRIDFAPEGLTCTIELQL